MEEARGLRAAADLAAVSARTAPKSKGEDFVKIQILEGEEVQRLAQAMVEYGRKVGRRNFDRDGDNVENSAAVLLIGLKDAKPCGLNCGACGFPTCGENVPRESEEFKGPQCAWRLQDLGIAVGSAVKTLSMLNVDNRIMYRIGAAARKMGLCDWDIVVGIPMSATGKNIYFDRKA
ncbi:MAG TPA: ferredoxin domain-containing protein [Candidatus Hypogeohydataceae bacterium YC38]